MITIIFYSFCSFIFSSVSFLSFQFLSILFNIAWLPSNHRNRAQGRGVILYYTQAIRNIKGYQWLRTFPWNQAVTGRFQWHWKSGKCAFGEIWIMSSWQPNPNAKPFTPASAYFSISVPCMKAPIRLRKKGILSRVIQWILVIVLCVTVVINVIFIWDTTRRYNKDSHVVNSDKTKVKINGLGRNENGGNTIFMKIEWLQSKRHI